MRNSIILSMTCQCNSMPGLRSTPFSTSAGQARQAKGRFPKYEGTNRCKWSISISLVIFHGKFAVKLDIRGFYE